ncbi:hypothetical protein PVK06_042629 [Gossypium arboreum]|uniref:Uncharacterized protein n=1 Tax=Gossypium arboreum TaxID=29729 RepID=A0ABR0MLJ3_GOSAR|nr:hypothetical protein PVK06_042629 [Gossypium arboreum]
MLNTEVFGNISTRFKAKAEELESLQLALLRGDLVRNGHIDRVSADLLVLQEAEAYKRNKHTITSLFDVVGNQLESFDQISVEILRFYQNLLGAIDSNVVDCSDFLLQELLPKLSNNAHRVLTNPITNEEIKLAIFGQGNEKAPGHDGFTTFFFKSAWGIVRPDFLEAVYQSAFVKGRSITDNTMLAHELMRGGTTNLVADVYYVLKQFYLLSGLQLRASKSELFVSEVS